MPVVQLLEEFKTGKIFDRKTFECENEAWSEAIMGGQPMAEVLGSMIERIALFKDELIYHAWSLDHHLGCKTKRVIKNLKTLVDLGDSLQELAGLTAKA